MTREERIAKMKNRQESGGEGSNRTLAYVIPQNVPKFVMKEGENRVDIIPYRISNQLNPAVRLDGFKLGDIDYFQHTHTHRGIGVNNNEYLCSNRMFGKPCAICNIQRDYWDANDRENAKKLYPFERAIYNVIDLDEPEKGIQVWEVSYNWVEKKLMELAAMKSKRGQTIVYGDWEIGKTVVFMGSKQKFGGREFIQPDNFTFEEREKPYDESICDKAYPLDQYYVIPDYSVVENDFLQVGDDSDTNMPSETPKVEVPKYVEKPLEKVEEAKPSTFEDFLEADAKLLESGGVIPPAPEPTQKRRRRESEPTTNKCPFGHRFGNDFDNHPDCLECKNTDYDACGDEFDKLQ